MLQPMWMKQTLKMGFAIAQAFPCLSIVVEMYQRKMAGWNLGSGLEIEHDPRWRVVARVFLPTRPSVNTAVHEAV